MVAIKTPFGPSVERVPLRKDYPVLRQERQIQVLIGPSGASPHDAGVILRFEQQDPDAWQVTLAPTFVSLSAKRYTRRSDFLSRLTIVLHALDSWLDPKVCDRVGVRYIDRVTGEHLAQLAKLVRPEVLGIKGVPTDGGVEVVHTLADALFRLDDASELRSRWGLLPAGATYDPGIEPAGEHSWVLDLDHYRLPSLGTLISLPSARGSQLSATGSTVSSAGR
ncbi:MAG: TIGR04255 family protein [Mycobacteriales bacterium]